MSHSISNPVLQNIKLSEKKLDEKQPSNALRPFIHILIFPGSGLSYVFSVFYGLESFERFGGIK